MHPSVGLYRQRTFVGVRLMKGQSRNGEKLRQRASANGELYEGRSINKLQNSVILLVFQI